MYCPRPAVRLVQAELPQPGNTKQGGQRKQGGHRGCPPCWLLPLPGGQPASWYSTTTDAVTCCVPAEMGTADSAANTAPGNTGPGATEPLVSLMLSTGPSRTPAAWAYCPARALASAMALARALAISVAV